MQYLQAGKLVSGFRLRKNCFFGKKYRFEIKLPLIMMSARLHKLSYNICLEFDVCMLSSFRGVITDRQNYALYIGLAGEIHLALV